MTGEFMNQERLEGIKVCVFDAYGTLFDYASAAAQCRDELGGKLDGLNTLWREKQLQYTWLRTLKASTRIFGRSPAMPWISLWR